MATRIFAAFYPPLETLDEAAGLLAQVRETTGLGLRWLPIEQWHITLAFYGETAAGALQEIQEELSQLAYEYAPLELNLKGAGHFSYRIFWLGLGGTNKTELEALASSCHTIGVRAGVQLAEGRAYLPHLSVARHSARGRYRDRQAERGYRRQLRQARKQGLDPALLEEPQFVTDDIDAAVHALNIFRGTTFTVDSIKLVESTLGDGPGGGPLHHVVDHFPLRGLN